MISKVLLFAIISQWIYEPDNVAHDLFRPLHVSERFGIVETGDGECVIVHRGTSTIDDSLHDIMSQVSSDCEDGYGKYFYDSFREYSNELEHYMLKYKNKCKKYAVTGHSLGGSAAIINMQHPDVYYGITYGSPKTCCNNRVAEENLFRIVNGVSRDYTSDPIPSLPKHKSFTNCGEKVVNINHESGFIEYRKSPRFISDPLVGSIKNLDKHKISNYVETLS